VPVVSEVRTAVGCPLLDRPKPADLVISDLTRGEDRSVVPRMAELCRNGNDRDQTLWCRVPIINYLRACPRPTAKTALEELTLLDPDAARQARFYFSGAYEPPAGSSRPATPGANEGRQLLCINGRFTITTSKIWRLSVGS
jgi:hypothetical protein